MQTDRTLRVVIVDDTRMLRELLEYTVEHDDRFSVAGSASDGGHAIRLVDGNPPDAIILDLQMPGVDGLTALPRLRQLCPDAIIVAHSIDVHDMKRAIALGASMSVTKGTGLGALLDGIAAWADNPPPTTATNGTVRPEQARALVRVGRRIRRVPNHLARALRHSA